MTWPFILHTVSPRPSVRKCLLILALNLSSVNVTRGAGKVRDEGVGGQRRPCTFHPVLLINSPSHIHHPSSALSLQAVWARDAAAPPEVKVREREPFQCRDPCHFFRLVPKCWREEKRGKRVEWQTDSRHNKTVIERCLITTISGRGKL